ncbi:hypothetical protein [Solemya velesiana gill symbiont]|uniref:Uncharacterized protein n=1 Tax=Solemya velesiana gill symbiont TaxID=1918948 RepID=A0A1T2KUF1_9GAMM|nr:hypothetical protein [Solemya velesiana gill symbiont]OOZ36489.1 hypothetical protein BOW51_06945 [Solemya velesiana gill symbiont]
MLIPPADLDRFAETFQQASGIALKAWEDAGLNQPPSGPDPEMLSGAMEQLLDRLKSQQGDDTGSPGAPREESSRYTANASMSELGHYALNILEELSVITGDLGSVDSQKSWELLSVSLARWLAVNRWELHSLGLVVNGFAFLANRSSSPEALESLSRP